MIRRAIIIAAGSGLVLFAAACLLSPFAAAARFEAAVMQRDEARLHEAADFKPLVADLRARTRARVMAAMHTDDELHHNPLAGLGLAIVPEIAERRVQAQVSPEGLFVLLATGEPPLTPIEAAHPPSPAERPDVRRHVRVRGLDTFELRVRRADAPVTRETVLEFTRHGLLAWRLTRLTPPP